MKKNNKYQNVLTLINSSAYPGVVIVVKSNNELDNNLMFQLQNFNIMLPTYIDSVGITRANDIIIDDVTLEKISFDNELTTCKMFVNN